jgi:biopolymer transport protein ExbD
MSEINVTPMIDVMIVLLVLFMVVTPVLANYAVKLPLAGNVSPETESDVVELAIDRAGAYWVGNQKLPTGELESYLTRVYGGRPGDHLLYLRADGAAGYDRILDAVDAARAAGVRRIGAITQPARPAPPGSARAGG